MTDQSSQSDQSSQLNQPIQLDQASPYYSVSYSTQQHGLTTPENTLYIVDGEPGTGDILDISVSVTQDSSNFVILATLPSQDPTPSPTNFHFRITFPTGVILTSPQGITLTDDSWKMSVVEDPSGTNLYFVKVAGGSMVEMDFTLTSFGISSQGNPSQTNVGFEWNRNPEYVHVTDNGQPVSYLGPTLTSAQIIEFEISDTPPLSFGFDTTNTVLNDGTHKNDLVLRIANEGTLALPLDPSKAEIVLSFDAGSDTTQRWVLAAPHQVDAFYLPGKLDSSGVDSHWSGYGAWNVERLSNGYAWKLTPKGSNPTFPVGEAHALEIPISNIVTGHATGRAVMHVQYRGFIGCNDGQTTVEVEKIPLLFGGSSVATSGNIGIGTTSPSHPLHIQAPSTGIGLSHEHGGVQLVTYVDSSGARVGTGSQHPLFFSTSGSAPQLTLTTDGKLGIGTTSPYSPLEIRAASSWGLMHTSGDASDDSSIVFGSYLGSDYVQLGTRYSHDLQLITDNSARITLTSDGKIGIGTTSPDRPVQLDAKSSGIGFSHQYDGVELVTYINSSGGWLGTNSNHPLFFMTDNGSAQLTLTTAGKLGIGTKTPYSQLEVRASESWGLMHTSGDPSDDSSVVLGSYLYSDHAQFGTKSNHDFQLISHNSARVTLEAGGKVGVNTSSPAETLHVDGNLRVDGEIIINGNRMMEFESYESDDNDPTWDTSYAASDWIPIIAGYDAHGAGSCSGLIVGAQKNEKGNWQIVASIHNTHDDLWKVYVLFIRRELVGDHSGQPNRTLQ